MQPSERIRFRRNPRNVATPQGFDDLYVNADGDLVKEDLNGVKKIVPAGAEGILEQLQGAAEDPDRIGEEYLPEIVTVSGIKMSNSGAVSQDADTLGLNSRGNLFFHNGEDTGDYLPEISAMWSIRGHKSITAGENQAGVVKKLGSFFLPASEAIVGTKYRVIGSISARMGSDSNTPSFLLGFCPVSSMAETYGVGFLNSNNCAFIQVTCFSLMLELTDGTTEFILAPSSDITNIGGSIRGVSAGTVACNVSNAPTSSDTETGPLNTDQEIGFYYTTAASASAPATDVAFDLKIEKIA